MKQSLALERTLKLLVCVLIAFQLNVYAAKNPDYVNLVQTGTFEEIEKAVSGTSYLTEMTFGENKETLLMIALGSNRDWEIVNMLVEHGSKIAARAKDKRTPIMFASQYISDPSVVEYLITYGTALNVGTKDRVEKKDKSGKTAFDYAAENSTDGILEVLQKYSPSLALKTGGNEARVRLEKYYNELAHDGSEKEIRQAFNAYPSLSDYRFSGNGETFLMLLLKNDRDWDEISRAIFEGSRIDAVDDNGVTPVMYCAKYSTKPDVLSRLIKDSTLFKAGTKARVSCVDSNGKSVYDYALENPDPDFVAVVDGFYPSVRATGNANLKAVEIEVVQETPAAEPEAQTEVALVVPALEKEPGKKAEDYTPTYIYDYIIDEAPQGSAEGTVSSFPLIIPDSTDENGVTLLMKAAKSGRTKDVKRLLDSGADVKKRDKEGWTALMYAVRYQNDMECITLLSEAGSSLRVRSKYNTTPLLLAAEYSQNPEILEFLLKNREAFEDEVFNAFILALTSSAGDENIRLQKISMFIEHGVPINRIWNGRTALMYASQYCSHTEPLSLLLEAGAKTQIRDSNGKTAFDYAQANIRLEHNETYWNLNK